MRIAKQLSRSGATEESIQQLEAKLGSRLPEDYRRFLTDLNGGRPDPSSFVFETKAGLNDSAVRYFLTLDSGEIRYTIPNYLNTYKDRIPKGVLPIGCDSFGNLVLLDVCSKSPGSVYFWDHEEESMNERTWQNISIVAPSFKAFEEALE